MEIEINLAEWMQQARKNVEKGYLTTIDQDMAFYALIKLENTINGGKDLAPAFSEILRISCYLAYERILQAIDDDQPFPDNNLEIERIENAEEAIALKEKIKRLEDKNTDLQKALQKTGKKIRDWRNVAERERAKILKRKAEKEAIALKNENAMLKRQISKKEKDLKYNFKMMDKYHGYLLDAEWAKQRAEAHARCEIERSIAYAERQKELKEKNKALEEENATLKEKIKSMEDLFMK